MTPCGGVGVCLSLFFSALQAPRTCAAKLVGHADDVLCGSSQRSMFVFSHLNLLLFIDQGKEAQRV